MAPKDKASAENEALHVTRYIIGALRNTTFTDFNVIRNEVYRLMDNWNDMSFQKRDGTRRLIFEECERPLLRKLPETEFPIYKWVLKRKVQKNSHVAYMNNYYSVDYHYVGDYVDLKICEPTLEIYSDDARLTTHRLFKSYQSNQYSTHECDLPVNKSFTPWNTNQIINWANNIGPNTTITIQRILESAEHHEQGYNACLAVLRIERKYGMNRS